MITRRSNRVFFYTVPELRTYRIYSRLSLTQTRTGNRNRSSYREVRVEVVLERK